jgi:hypothetical protein
VKQTVGGVEILEGEVAIGITPLLENGVHAAEARISQPQLTGGVAAQAVAAILEIELLQPLATRPELNTGLVRRELWPDGPDRRWTPAPLALEASRRKLPPGGTRRLRSPALKGSGQQRVRRQAVDAAQP